MGNVEIVALLDLALPPLEPSQFFPDVPTEAWERYRHYLDEDGKFRTNFCSFVVRTPNRVLLVDTGLGPGPHPNAGGKTGALLQQLSGLGLQPADVDTIVITHLHGDHIGWNVDDEGDTPRPRFPRARYIIPKGDWDYFTSPDLAPAQAEAVQSSVVPLQDLGLLEIVEGPYSVTPEITTLPTPGHTPGHQCVTITSQGEKGILVGDLFHSAVQVEEPDWCAGPDMEKEAARASRQALLDRLEQEGFAVAAPHLLFNQNIGRVVRAEGRTYWQVI